MSSVGSQLLQFLCVDLGLEVGELGGELWAVVLDVGLQLESLQVGDIVEWEFFLIKDEAYVAGCHYLSG